MKFVSSTDNKYEKILRMEKESVSSKKEKFIPSVRINFASPYSNKTEMVTGKKVTFKHV